MPATKHHILSILLALTVTSCAHKDIAKSSPQIGQSKSDIVEVYGSPQRSWREGGKDRWLYDSPGVGRKILVFENGILAGIDVPGSQKDEEDLEAELKKLKPNSSGTFKDIDGE